LGPLDLEWQALTDSKSELSWILFGFDSTGKKLEPQEKGTGGLSALAGKFDEKQIQFAALKVVTKDQASSRLASSRPKYIGITWVGKSVSPMKRIGGLKAKDEVAKVFRGAGVWTQYTDTSEISAKDLARQLSHSGGDQVDEYDFGDGTVVKASEIGGKDKNFE